MNNKCLVTVTDSIEGHPVNTYLDTIESNVVLGTNFFSDFFASFSDIFGGTSGTYKRKLEMIYKDVITELKDKAIALGGNAIVGLKIDFDEISGKGKSMFMVSAVGTACIVENLSNSIFVSENNKKRESVGNEILETEITKRLYLDQLQKDSEYIVNKDIQEFFQKNPTTEILEPLLNQYIVMHRNDPVHMQTLTFEFIEKYFLLLPKDDVTENVYGKYKEASSACLYLIKKDNLFVPKYIFEFCKDDFHSIIPLLECTTESYTQEDLEYMELIVREYEKLPNTGKIELAKNGMFGKEEELYICENGHKSSKSMEFCKNCKINIKGFSESEMEIFRNFQNKTKVLSDLLSRVNI